MVAMGNALNNRKEERDRDYWEQFLEPSSSPARPDSEKARSSPELEAESAFLHADTPRKSRGADFFSWVSVDVFERRYAMRHLLGRGKSADVYLVLEKETGEEYAKNQLCELVIKPAAGIAPSVTLAFQEFNTEVHRSIETMNQSGRTVRHAPSSTRRCTAPLKP